MNIKLISRKNNIKKSVLLLCPMEEVVGKIYKLTSKNTNKVYYGSTTFVFLSMRLLNHDQCYHSYKLGKRGYQSSFDIIECGDYKIELVEDVVGTDKKDLLTRERTLLHRK